MLVRPDAGLAGRQRRDLYSDDPAAMTEDRLGRQRLAGQMARILQTVAEHSESSVAALVGSWGCGKTTLVDEVRKSLKESGWYVTSHIRGRTRTLPARSPGSSAPFVTPSLMTFSEGHGARASAAGYLARHPSARLEAWSASTPPAPSAL